MSGFQGHDRDFSEYNHMSTDDLEAILRADFELPESEESDMEKILYITEVIAQRRAGQPTGRYTNEDEAWESFIENYCPEEDREVLRGSNAAEKPRRGKRILTRVAAIAAVIMLAAAAGTVTASAFGFDLWEWLTGWTRGIFSVQDPTPDPPDVSYEIPEQLSSLQEAMEKHGFPDGLLPTWLPDGYEIAEVFSDITPSYAHLAGRLANDKNASITLDYYMHLDNETAFEVQKDGDNPEAYENGDVTYYITTNFETYYATWAVDNAVCVMSGFTFRDELIQVIKSIDGG